MVIVMSSLAWCFHTQISEMKDGLGGREAELKYLHEQLTEATKERDRERAANLKNKVIFLYSENM